MIIIMINSLSSTITITSQSLSNSLSLW